MVRLCQVLQCYTFVWTYVRKSPGILSLKADLGETYGYMAKRPERKGRIFADSETTDIPPVTEEKAERLSFPLTAEGAIAVEQLRPATRDKLRAALAPASVRSAIFGGPVVPAGPSPEDAAICGALYDTVSSILVSIYRASGYSLEQAELARYSDEQKKALVPLTAKVFAKWVGDFAYMDELMLCVMLATITSQNVQAVQATRSGPARVVNMPTVEEPSA